MASQSEVTLLPSERKMDWNQNDLRRFERDRERPTRRQTSCEINNSLKQYTVCRRKSLWFSVRFKPELLCSCFDSRDSAADPSQKHSLWQKHTFWWTYLQLDTKTECNATGVVEPATLACKPNLPRWKITLENPNNWFFISGDLDVCCNFSSVCYKRNPRKKSFPPYFFLSKFANNAILILPVFTN